MKNITAIIIFSIILTGCAMNFGDKKYEWFASGNAPELYPTELFFGEFVFSNGKRLYIPTSIPFANTTWGRVGKTHFLNNNMFPAPESIYIIWLSLTENQFYSLEAALPKEKIASLLSEINEDKEQKYNFIVAGMAPYGGLAIWLVGNGITTEVTWLQAKQTEVEMNDFAPGITRTQKVYVEDALRQRHSCKKAYANFQKNGLPDRMLYERYMQKFNYRITPKFEDKDVVLKGIELYYYNGELNTTNSGEHALNAMRAKPYKIVLNWSIGEAKYSGYFWTDEKKIIETFSKFYGSDAQKEGNLVIEAGKTNENFKFSLQDNSSEVEIPAEDMQIIIFKDKLESWRSPNYNRPPDGWRD